MDKFEKGYKLDNFLSRGSFGNIYYDKTSKKINKYVYLYDDNLNIIENNIKEIFFYCLIAFKYFPKVPISIPKIYNITLKNNLGILSMPYYGISFNKISFSDKSIKYIYDLIRAVNFLHHYSFSHGDIKPANILVDNEQLYLIDYGSVCYNHESSNNNFHHRCTLYYISPEECKGKRFFLSTDIWSIGLIIFEHITNKRFIYVLLKEIGVDKNVINELLDNTKMFKKPYQFLEDIFEGLTQKDINKIIDKYIYYSDNTTIYYKYNCIVKECLVIDYNNRINAISLLGNNLFKEYNNEEDKYSKLVDNFYSYQLNSISSFKNIKDKNITNCIKIFLLSLYSSLLQVKKDNSIYILSDEELLETCIIISRLLIMNDNIYEDNNTTQNINNIKKVFSCMPQVLKNLQNIKLF